jgi:L-amino acid N-acyltransferase YncA
MHIRVAKASDAEAIAAIYLPIVRDTAISFETDPPDAAEMKRRIKTTLRDLPWLVSEDDEGIAGYAYASHHRERAAYQWSVDVSIYVAPERRRKGVARSLYTPLLTILKNLGYFSAYAGIALPNAASVAFHRTMGFQPVGIFRNTGYKLGSWRDVGWWQRPLREYVSEPKPPRRFGDLGPDEVQPSLHDGA